MNECPQCGLKFTSGPECPNCSHRVELTSSFGARPTDLIQNYLHDVKTILLSPARFFHDLPLNGGLSRPLTFALVTHWIGSAFRYLWGQFTANGLEKVANKYMHFSMSGADIDSPARFNQWMQAQQKISHLLWSWMWGAGSIILDPFTTIVMIFLSSLFVFVGARLFVNSSRQADVTYESVVRLVAYGMTPGIVAVFPFLGSLLAPLYVIVVTIIGAREMFRISNGRAALVALFPKLLFIGIIAMGILFFFFAALKLLASAIH